MTDSTLQATQSRGPIALLVEDELKSLRPRLALLKEYGFLTLAVQSVADALKEFSAAPGIDLVITDIRLKPNVPGDKSGVLLAEQLKAIAEDLPIVGYSAAFVENDLTETERSLFTTYFPKGSSGASEIPKHIEAWRELAQQFHDNRLMHARAKLETYRDKYGLTEPQYSTLRFLIPNKLIETEGNIASIEDVLHEAGFELRLIERGEARPTLDEHPARVRSPILLWVRNDGEASVAEVYGFPELYGSGEDRDEAVRNVLLLMDGFHQDFNELIPSSDSLERLAEFLRTVFE